MLYRLACRLKAAQADEKGFTLVELLQTISKGIDDAGDDTRAGCRPP
jgi:hypothetical protein